MPAGNSGPVVEEPVISSATVEGGREDRMSSAQQVRGVQSTSVGLHVCGEVAQEDEEMTSGSHDLASPDNHSATGSTSASTKRYYDNQGAQNVIRVGGAPFLLFDLKRHLWWL